MDKIERNKDQTSKNKDKPHITPQKNNKKDLTKKQLSKALKENLLRRKNSHSS
jgi:hypothetical protein